MNNCIPHNIYYIFIKYIIFPQTKNNIISDRKVFTKLYRNW